MMLGKILYGVLFIVIVPGLLVLWVRGAQPNISLPPYGDPIVGSAISLFGLIVMAAAMWQLWVFGGGLPMNAFPPTKLVSRGLFYWLPHPIYTAFAAICVGVSMIAGSAAGLWLVSPCAVLACTALVLGYERRDLQSRFGETLRLLPPGSPVPPSNADRIKFVIVVLVPWAALYEFTIHMRLHGVAVVFPFEKHWPTLPWTVLIYQSCYLAVASAAWCARTKSELRQLMISAWLASALVFPVSWIFPGGALPSFHVVWATLIGRLYRPKWLGIAYAASVAISCLTSGMHSLADVLTAILIAPLLLHPQRAWQRLIQATEWIANSWQERRFGALRVINHSFYAGSAGFVHVAIMSAALAPKDAWKSFAAASAGVVGAGVWAQWVEGSSLLRRPFGFYGGQIALGLACLLFGERWILLGACCLAAPWMQAAGRLRCLVNGCCHGAAAVEPHSGIRVYHERSRVTRLANLRGIAIYPTQLYSILGNVFVGLVLLRLWWTACPLSLICGVYLLGNGIFRFVEEAYRGEPQTVIVLGLRFYQWMALASVAGGAAVTTLRWPSAPILVPTSQGLLYALAFAMVSGIAMGVDFPEANRPLARLT